MSHCDHPGPKQGTCVSDIVICIGQILRKRDPKNLELSSWSEAPVIQVSFAR